MKTIQKLSFLIFIFSINQLLAQSEQIKGIVTNLKGAPMEFVNVGIKGKNKGAVTNYNGLYKISNIEPGIYTIIASSVGYNTQVKEISLSNGQVLEINFTLTEDVQYLSEVEVIGRKATTYKSDYSYAATKTGKEISKIPASVSTVTKELIADQLAYNLSDVLKNISGVNNNSSGTYNDLRIRGFRSHSSGTIGTANRFINGLKASQGFFTSPNLFTFERVEVLKGPASSIYGNVNPGGMVNLVTKKPLDEYRNTIQFVTGSFNTLRTNLDVTGPFNENKKLLYRLNIAYDRSNTFRDFSSYKNFTIAPSVTYKATEKTTINAEVMFNKYDGYIDRGVPVPGQDYDAVDVALTIAQPSDFYKVDDTYLMLTMNHKFSDNVSFNASYLKYVWDEELNEHRTSNNWVDDGAQVVSSIRYWERIDDRNSDFLTGYFSIKAGDKSHISHEIVTGLDYYRFKTLGGTVTEARQKRVYDDDGNFTGFEELTFDLLNPEYYNRVNDINDYDFFVNRAIGDREADYAQTGIYAQDIIGLMNDKLNIMLGARLEFLNNKIDYRINDSNGITDANETIFIPRIGVSYTLNDNLHVYGNYSEGFTPISPDYLANPQEYRPDGSDIEYEHETNSQYEFGIKGDFLNKKLFASLAYFDIKRENVLMSTNELTASGDDAQIQNGAELSSGLEFDIVGRITPNWSITANYAYLDTEVSDNSQNSTGTIGVDFVEGVNGLPIVGAPKHSFGFWTKYSFDQGFFKDFGFSIGGNYVSERRHSNSETSLEIPTDEYFYEIPEYFVADSALYYTFDKFKISMNINNIFDKKHWVGAYDFLRSFPGSTRSYNLNVGYTF